VRRALGIVLVIAIALVGWRFVRKALRPAPPRPDAQAFAHAANVRIVRDVYGVPHIFGKTDADAAFGLAYAHSEDDWPTIHAVTAASTGRLSLLYASKKAAGNDWYVGLVRVREQVDAQYDALAPDYRAVLEGYARGLNFYAWKHPEESDGRLFPVSGRDVAAGFAHKIPFMLDVPLVIGELLEGGPKKPPSMPGSNAHAVAASRSPDGVTRLNVNSHQPWEGPVTWYEVHVVSEEGWNMTGGLFPGAPIVLHGHNDRLGWAHTVNSPDLVDVYALNDTAALEEKDVPLTIDTGLFDLHVSKAAHWSKLHDAPVVKTEKGAWAIRYAGIGRALQTGQQWFRMNKAKTLAEWKEAMRIQAIPMFNTVYADAEHIAYVYNALIPKRPTAPGVDWAGVIPGDRPDLVWNEYLPFDALPMVVDPPSGFVMTCNSTPFAATTGANANPPDSPLYANAGIERDVNNRARRSLALFGTDAPIDRDTFLRFKFDRTYAPDAKIFGEAFEPLVGGRAALGELTHWEREALDILAAWDGRADEHSSAATIAILVWSRTNPKTSQGFTDVAPLSPRDALRGAVAWLVERFGRVDVPLGEAQRLRRGTVDLPLGGGPDVLNAVRAKDDGERLVGFQGDSYVLVVDFPKDGPATSESIHQYGASNRPSSPHHADQAASFTALRLKPTLRDPAVLARKTERAYHPGD
jgi:acyl-homoserine-lactone acylase